MTLPVISMMFCYKRASPGIAFVRSGVGGAKAVVNAGAIVLPVLNEVTWVNLTAMRMETMCCDGDALPFRDCQWEGRVEWIVRVAPREEAVLKAASTWGDKTLAPLQLQPLIEAQLVEALRRAAAQTTLADALTERAQFTHRAQDALVELFNGLELESLRLREAPCNQSEAKVAPSRLSPQA